MPRAPGLRPTPDRVRETLFNWLQGRLAGGRCLDLFAGSGALGFEAASRGAASVVMVERRAAVARHLRGVVQELGDAPVRVVQGDAHVFLRGTGDRFDIVFLDPPFGSGMLEAVFELLPGWVRPGGRVYVEQRSDASLPPLPPGWRVLRRARAGEVGAYLLEAADPPTEGADRRGASG